MDIKNNNGFYSSTEAYSDLLPAKFKFEKRLKVTAGDLNREVALISLEVSAIDFLPQYLVIAPRDPDASLFDASNAEPVFLYVVDGIPYKDAETIDLSQPLEYVDIGCITGNIDAALTWQLSKSNIQDAKETLEKFKN